LDEDRAELEQLSRSRTLPHREAQRAALILGYYGRREHGQYWETSGDDGLSVSKMGAKALAVGPMAALKDSYPAQGPVIGDDAKAWVFIWRARPKDLGYRPKFGVAALAKHVREHAVQAGFPALSGRPSHRASNPCEHLLHPEKGQYYWNAAILILRGESQV